MARVTSLVQTHEWAKAGVMIRDSLDPGSAHALAVVTASEGVAFQRRVSANGESQNTSAEGGVPQWLKLVRVGGSLTAQQSLDGSVWTTVGSETVPMTGTVYVGLALTSHNNGVLTTANFSAVSLDDK